MEKKNVATVGILVVTFVVSPILTKVALLPVFGILMATMLKV